MASPELKMITIDCPDAEAEARFWSTLLDWEIVASGEGYAMLAGPGVAVGFCSVPDHQPPGWPNAAGSKQFHFDLAVDDLDEAEQTVRRLGGSVPEEQEDAARWRVCLDPAGHPFCLTLAANWG